VIVSEYASEPVQAGVVRCDFPSKLLMRAEPKANTRGLPTLPALASPLNGIVEIGESGQFRFADWLSCFTAQQQPAPSVKGA
jgi:hypothetical protein